MLASKSLMNCVRVTNIEIYDFTAACAVETAMHFSQL